MSGPVRRRPAGPPRSRSSRAPPAPPAWPATDRSSAAAACRGSSGSRSSRRSSPSAPASCIVGARGFGAVVGGIGSTLGGFVKGVTATPSPLADRRPVSVAPTLDQPSEPYTSQSTVDLVVTVPAEPASATRNHRIRLYLALPGPAGGGHPGGRRSPTRPKTVIPGIELTDGINDFSVDDRRARPANRTIRRSSATSSTTPRPRSPSPRPRTMRSSTARRSRSRARPRRGRRCWHATTRTGRRSRAPPNRTARSRSAWRSRPGSTRSRSPGTDPAGNTAQATVSVKRGTGKLTVALTRVDLHHQALEAARAGDPDGDRHRPRRASRWPAPT